MKESTRTPTAAMPGQQWTVHSVYGRGGPSTYGDVLIPGSLQGMNGPFPAKKSVEKSIKLM